MNLDYLSPLDVEPGPVASLYLDTTRRSPDAGRALDLRYRELRAELADQGADAPTLAEAVPYVVVADRVGADITAYGPHGARRTCGTATRTRRPTTSPSWLPA